MGGVVAETDDVAAPDPTEQPGSDQMSDALAQCERKLTTRCAPVAKCLKWCARASESLGDGRDRR
jgi:hypothetical protein